MWKRKSGTEKHIRWFLLLFISAVDFIFHKKSISVMSKYLSKSVQVLTVAEMPSSKSLLSLSGFIDSMSVFCPQSLRHSYLLSTFSSACFYFSYLAQFQFTCSHSSVTAFSAAVNQGQATVLHKTSQGSWPARLRGHRPHCVPEPDCTAQERRVAPL